MKVHIKEQKQTFERFNAQWTPIQVVLDPEGKERHRMEGFLPVDDLLAQLELGPAKIAFQHKAFGDAEKRFRAGVAAYKARNDVTALNATAKLLKEKYPASEWARKASVWL